MASLKCLVESELKTHRWYGLEDGKPRSWRFAKKKMNKYMLKNKTNEQTRNVLRMGPGAWALVRRDVEKLYCYLVTLTWNWQVNWIQLSCLSGIPCLSPWWVSSPTLTVSFSNRRDVAFRFSGSTWNYTGCRVYIRAWLYPYALLDGCLDSIYVWVNIYVGYM